MSMSIISEENSTPKPKIDLSALMGKKRNQDEVASNHGASRNEDADSRRSYKSEVRPSYRSQVASSRRMSEEDITPAPEETPRLSRRSLLASSQSVRNSIDAHAT